MKHFRKIPFWTNKARQKEIEKYISLLEDFYANPYSPENRNTRKEINLAINRVHIIMAKAGISPYIVYTPAPITGGYIQNVDVVLNFDNLRHYHIPEEKVFDFLYITLGKYRDDYPKSVIRTFNPLFWIGCIIDYFIIIPFNLLGWVGINKEKAESSLIGRLIKTICKSIIILAALLTALHYLGYLEVVKKFINKGE